MILKLLSVSRPVPGIWKACRKHLVRVAEKEKGEWGTGEERKEKEKEEGERQRKKGSE